jgi:hypothetical protein
MHAPSIDDLALRAATAVTRRRSLLALGGAALAANVASRTGLTAQDKDKQKAKKAKKKARQRCNQQKAQCRAAGGGDFAMFGCCESCYADDFLACLISLVD